MAAGPRVLWMPGGVRTEIHLGTADTGGAFCLIVDEPPPGWSLPPHSHRHEDETIHVVAGVFEIDVGGVRSVVSSGETIHIPRGVRHSGQNVGPVEGRRVVVFSPAGMEDFFLEAGTADPEAGADPAAALAAAVRHGWEFGTRA